MRILVMFDLPTRTKREKRDYLEFRKFLKVDGYEMIQFSVYSRVCLGRNSLDSHITRIKKNLPPSGTVIAFVMTERQFQDRYLLVGSPQDGTSTSTQLTLEI